MGKILVSLIAVTLASCATNPSTDTTVSVPSICEMDIDSRAHELLKEAVAEKGKGLTGLYCGSWGGVSPAYLIVVKDGETLEYFYHTDIRGSTKIHAEGKARWEEPDKEFSFNARGARVYMEIVSNYRLDGRISTYGGWSKAGFIKVHRGLEINTKS